MRTLDQIVARIRKVSKSDFLGFETGDLIARLPFEQAKEFLKEGAPGDKWKPLPRDRESLLKEMRDYMPFAWDKANNCRGISASRSMSHYSAWTWLSEDEDKLPNLHEYEHYGKENLVAICNLYGWDHAQWDDGRRVNSDTE